MEFACSYWIEGKHLVPIHSLCLYVDVQLTRFFYLDDHPKPLFNLLRSDDIVFKYILSCFQMWHI